MSFSVRKQPQINPIFVTERENMGENRSALRSLVNRLITLIVGSAPSMPEPLLLLWHIVAVETVSQPIACACACACVRLHVCMHVYMALLPSCASISRFSQWCRPVFTLTLTPTLFSGTTGYSCYRARERLTLHPRERRSVALFSASFGVRPSHAHKPTAFATIDSRHR